MVLPDDQARVLRTSAGDFPLHEYRLRQNGHEWSILHTNAVLSVADESHFLRELKERVPYGVALWPSAIALAHDVASRPDEFAGKQVLELGAGTGLPGIVAATLGGRVLQSDRQALALSMCRRNGERNKLSSIDYRLDDWSTWADTTRYDWLLGSDILYGAAMHPYLRQIFEANLAPNGRILIADPFREASMPLLEELEAVGWTISLSKWSIGEEAAPRPIGVFELSPP